MSAPSDAAVLIVGAGPTGLVLALWLTQQGVQVRVVDKAAEAGTTSRAVGVQARTLELYRQLDLADTVVGSGVRVAAVNLWVEGARAAHLPVGDIGRGLSPFPFVLMYPQDEHERLLIARLAASGVHVERQTELLGLEQDGAVVRATLSRAGVQERVDVGYVAGCDGAHSAVRAALGVGFPGGTYARTFYVADVQAMGAALNHEIHVDLDESDSLAVFPLKGEGRARLVGTLREEHATDRIEPTMDDVSHRALEQLRLGIVHVNWFSTYRVHHRVANRFRERRVFLLGDAAHIHSPVGAQGMNTGIGDAINLAWKLAAVVHRSSTPAVLDSYEPERIAFARRLVETTDRAFTIASSTRPLARWIRRTVFPPTAAAVFRLPAARRLLFRTISQVAIRYRHSALSEGRAGRIRGGDRLPWVPGGSAASPSSGDNFEPLSSLGWQVHVYGDAPNDVRAACTALGLPLHSFSWTSEARRAGLARHAAYLVRPDGYIAAAGADGDRLQRYFAQRALKPVIDRGAMGATKGVATDE